jgi:hypothetical protein
MALDERYIIASDLEQYFVDKDSGLPLANGTLTFFRDDAPNTSKEVFQLSGSPGNYSYTSMGSIITLSSVGTVQNSGGDNVVIYYYPYRTNDQGELVLDLYYVICRNSDGIEQFTRQAWPNITSANDPTQDDTSLQNQISNPTFTNVFINQPPTVGGTLTTIYTATAASSEVFAFAPDWDFVISGTGTVTVSRVAISGNDNVVTSPPYVIDVAVSSGITVCYLRQRFNYNSGLWASTSGHDLFLAGSFVARNEGGGTSGIQMLYEESSGGSQVTIVDGIFSTNYALITGATENAIPASTNTDLGKNGYVDILLSFAPLTNVRVTSIQVVPTTGTSINIVPFDTNSSNREEALQGDYYLPRLIQKRIDSYLVGWDFPISPFQFAASGNIAATAAYITDQTIALRGATGNVAWAQSAMTGGLEFTTAGTNDAFYILQYLNASKVREMIGTKLSVNVFGYKTSVGDAVTMRVYLYRGSAAATFPTLPTSIGTLAADGTFTLTAANWTLIARSGLDTAKATLNVLASNDEINDGNYDYGFSQWEITDATELGDTDRFAMVVTFQYADASTVITINSISLVPGDLPCRPALKTRDQSIQECQFYYEKSYNQGVFAGAVTAIGCMNNVMFVTTGGGFVDSKAWPFGFRFNTIKRTNPLLHLYPIEAPIALNEVTITNRTNGLSRGSANVLDTFWEPVTGEKGVSAIVVATGNLLSVSDGGSVTSPTAEIRYHYVADARLGSV